MGNARLMALSAALMILEASPAMFGDLSSSPNPRLPGVVPLLKLPEQLRLTNHLETP